MATIDQRWQAEIDILPHLISRKAVAYLLLVALWHLLRWSRTNWLPKTPSKAWTWIRIVVYSARMEMTTNIKLFRKIFFWKTFFCQSEPAKKWSLIRIVGPIFSIYHTISSIVVLKSGYSHFLIFFLVLMKFRNLADFPSKLKTAHKPILYSYIRLRRSKSELKQSKKD